MNVEELKARLRALLHQRDMLAYEHASLELFDLIEEVDEEIRLFIYFKRWCFQFCR